MSWCKNIIIVGWDPLGFQKLHKEITLYGIQHTTYRMTSNAAVRITFALVAAAGVYRVSLATAFCFTNCTETKINTGKSF